MEQLTMSDEVLQCHVKRNPIQANPMKCLSTRLYFNSAESESESDAETETQTEIQIWLCNAEWNVLNVEVEGEG